MKDKLGADGDFAQGYVIAHEVGHHVQKLCHPPGNRTAP
ncbi:neutral zinc metallopeptidase [Escherichia sp. TWPC-MK]